MTPVQSATLVRPEATARPTAATLFTLLDRIHAGGAFEDSPEQAQQSDRLRRRENRDELAADQALAVAAQAPRSAELIAKAEHDVEVGSRAFQREAARGDWKKSLQADRQAFRDALREGQASLAGSRGPKETPATTSTTGSPVRNMQTTSAGNPASASAAQSSQALATSQTTTVSEQPNAAPLPPAAARPEPASGGRSPTSAAPPLATGPTPPTTGPIASAPALAAAPAAATAARVSSVAAASPQGATPTGATGESGPSVAAASSSRAQRKSAAPPATPDSEKQAETAERSARIDRLVKAMHAQYREDGGTLKMRLDPPSLGEIKVEMQVHKGQVSVTIDTLSDVAHRLLREDAEALREGLEAGGLRLERFELRAPGSGPDGSGSDLTQGQTDAGGTQRQASGQSNAERSSYAGTEAPPPSEPAEDGPVTQRGAATLVAETRVNVLA